MVQLHECQMLLVGNRPAVDRLLVFAVRGPSLNIFTKGLLAETFFSLSFSTEAHSLLTEERVVSQLLQFCDICPDEFLHSVSLLAIR